MLLINEECAQDIKLSLPVSAIFVMSVQKGTFVKWTALYGILKVFLIMQTCCNTGFDKHYTSIERPCFKKVAIVPGRAFGNQWIGCQRVYMNVRDVYHVQKGMDKEGTGVKAFVFVC